MITFLGAAAYVMVPEDVQWARMGPYERSGGSCPKADLFDFGGVAEEGVAKDALFCRLAGSPHFKN